MAKRRAISKKIRFEVFKRDSFSCQYCGAKAPDIVLHIDHICPVSKGGTNDLLNLITSCEDCNSGKSNRELTDDSVVEKQRRQLDDLQEKKEQLEMMFKWQKGLLDIESETLSMLAEYWGELVPGYNLNKNGERSLKKLVKTFPLDEIMKSMKIATDQYIKHHDGDVTAESVEIAWKKVGGVCAYRKKGETDPNIGKVFYIKAILKNRGIYINEKYFFKLMRDAVNANLCLEGITELSKKVKHWNDFAEEIEASILHYASSGESYA